jgi:hypothetical protein
MKRQVSLWILVLILSFKSNGQDLIAEQTTFLDTKSSYMLFSFPVIDEMNDNLFLFIHHSEGFNGYQYTKGLGLNSEITSKHPRDKYVHFLGTTVKDSNVCLYMASDFYRKILVREFDFRGGTYLDTELKPFPADESYITSVSIGSLNYLLTVKKNSSMLGIHSFEGPNPAGSSSIDLSDVKFHGHTLYDALNSPSADAWFIPSIQNFTGRIISSEYTNAINKIFSYKGFIYLTINNDISCTHLLKIDPRNLSADHIEIRIPDGGFKSGNANSFFHKGTLYQIFVSKDGLNLSAYDLDKSVLVREYAYKESDSEIFFANTPVLARSASGYKHITPQQFLEKAGSGTPGLLVKNDGELTKVFTGITRSNTVYSFGGLFKSPLLEHVEGKLPSDVTSRINDFFSSAKVKPIGQTLFEFDGKTVFGYYNGKQMKYYLFEF